MKEPYNPPAIEETRPANEAELHQVLFLEEMQRRLGPISDKDERDFLFALADYTNTEGWPPEEWKSCAQLFYDFKTCLGVMDSSARKIGYCVSISGRVFKHPTHAVKGGNLIHVLEAIAKLRPWLR